MLVLTREARSRKRIDCQGTLLVSIVVVNYNYEKYLPAAIQSAIDQTYRHVEIVVVDDGSTDGSRRTIRAFEPQVIPVFKENGGQASAFNTGFERCSGDVVIFLDADDVLHPTIAEEVVSVFREHPGIARVHYRLEVVDSRGRNTGMVVPPWYLDLPCLDFGRDLRNVLNCASWAPTSGNAFAAWSLREILPMPERDFRICADFYLTRMNALSGPVRALDRVGAGYRHHAGNRFLRLSLDLDQIRAHIVLAQAAHRHIVHAVRPEGMAGPAETAAVDGTYLTQRMISLRLDPERHPVPGDRATRIWWEGVRASVSRTGLPVSMRAASAFWFTAMLLSPPALATSFAELHYPEQRGVAGRWLNAVKRSFTSGYRLRRS